MQADASVISTKPKLHSRRLNLKTTGAPGQASRRARGGGRGPGRTPGGRGACDGVSEFEWEERAQVQQLLHLHELGRATSQVLNLDQDSTSSLIFVNLTLSQIICIPNADVARVSFHRISIGNCALESPIKR